MSGPLAGRTVVLGVAGGIAAYKAVDLCRRLVDAGAHVAPVLTPGASRFVAPLTFSALASEPARTSLWDDESDPIPHTRLGRAADVVVVAPATAGLISRYAAGAPDDLLSALLLATTAPVVLCPAMHTEMWDHPAVRDNIALLRRRGVHVVEPGEGRLAGGDIGVGRLADLDDIVAQVQRVVGPDDLTGLRVVITAGGTREPIDPVRFVANRSSGKQGHALAEEAVRRGAAVTLVTAADRPGPRGAEVVRVETAAEMEEAVLARCDGADIVIMAAAVADSRPKAPAGEKLKKSEGPPELVLEPTPDILAEVARRRRPGQVIVGFAAETSELRRNAAAKLATKGVDLVVANDVSAPGAGFGYDTNEVVLVGADGSEQDVPRSDKHEVARAVLDAIIAVRSRTPTRRRP